MASSSSPSASSRPPHYSLVASSPTSDEGSSNSDRDSAFTNQHGGLYHTEDDARRQKSVSPPASRSCLSLALPPMPTRTRFLADFTLGFADGLTVPFALTAGLSSLGRTDTVLYAGAAEICAGSISMGTGGYLSARGEAAAAAADVDAASRQLADDRDGETEALDVAVDAEKAGGSARGFDNDHDDDDDGTVPGLAYLRPLDLPPALFDDVMQHVRSRPHVAQALVAAMAEAEREDDEDACSPVMVGLSVSLGYLLGGLLPLFPYFFVDQVGDGLFWSFGVCLVALFAFGFAKDFVLMRQRRREAGARQARLGTAELSAVGWRDVRHSAWEGLQMVLLGGVAALAAVLCVRAFEGLHVVAPGESP